MMPPSDWFYTVKPIEKKVSKQELDEYIASYPRKLYFDACGISDPPALSWNDFELAEKWPYSIVAHTWHYEDDPNDYWYEPEETRSYYIVENIEEVFASKTGRTDEEWHRQERERQETLQEELDKKGLYIKGCTNITITNAETGEVIYDECKNQQDV